MSTLSGKKRYAGCTHTENSLGKPHPFPQRYPQVYTPNVQYHTQRPCRGRSKYNLVHKALNDLRISPECYDPSDCYRRTSTADPPRRSSSGITKRRERLGQPIPLRPQKGVKEGASTQADTSLPFSSGPAPDSSCEQYVTITSTSLPDYNANEETAFHNSVGKDDDGDTCLTNEVPSSEQAQQDSEGDNATVLHEDDEQLALPSLIHPDTEYHANLAAASEECRDLFRDYYQRTHGDSRTETEDHTDPYWKWDQERHQWFHKDADTKSVVWFLG
ncbi:hypothetical protein F4824DRAFT_505359 [Ustulina deusta]|nr:hypothetical protein F4824DRAFT_505359 [Ustulina deusta]